MFPVPSVRPFLLSLAAACPLATGRTAEPGSRALAPLHPRTEREPAVARPASAVGETSHQAARELKVQSAQQIAGVDDKVEIVLAKHDGGLPAFEPSVYLLGKMGLRRGHQVV